MNYKFRIIIKMSLYSEMIDNQSKIANVNDFLKFHDQYQCTLPFRVISHLVSKFSDYIIYVFHECTSY